MRLIDWTVKKLLTLDPQMAKSENNPGSSLLHGETKRQVTRVSEHFVTGYNLAVEHEGAALARRLGDLDPAYRPFAYEGVGTSLYARDNLLPFGKGRFSAMCRIHGERYGWLLLVGAGLAIAKLPFARRQLSKRLVEFGPMYSSLTVEGIGFHDGFFSYERTVERLERPDFLPTAEMRSHYDRGVGRSICFTHGCAVDRVARRIATFSEERRATLWEGVGAAITFASAMEEPAIAEFVPAAGQYAPELRTGCLFATRLRVMTGDIAPWSAAASQAMLGLTVEAASDRYAELETAAKNVPPAKRFGAMLAEARRQFRQQRADSEAAAS